MAAYQCVSNRLIYLASTSFSSLFHVSRSLPIQALLNHSPSSCPSADRFYSDESLKNPCPSCDETFACLGGLLRHRRRKHDYETPNARGQREEPYEMAPSTGSSKENASNDSNNDKQASTSVAPQTEILPLQRTREWVNLLPATIGCDETAPAIDPHRV